MWFQEKAAEEIRPDSSASVGGKGDSKLTNQFNFSERASQTYNNPYRVSNNCVLGKQYSILCLEILHGGVMTLQLAHRIPDWVFLVEAPTVGP